MEKTEIKIFSRRMLDKFNVNGAFALAYGRDEYQSLYRLSPEELLKDLLKKGRLRAKDFVSATKEIAREFSDEICKFFGIATASN